MYRKILIGCIVLLMGIALYCKKKENEFIKDKNFLDADSYKNYKNFAHGLAILCSLIILGTFYYDDKKKFEIEKGKKGVFGRVLDFFRGKDKTKVQIISSSGKKVPSNIIVPISESYYPEEDEVVHDEVISRNSPVYTKSLPKFDETINLSYRSDEIRNLSDEPVISSLSKNSQKRRHKIRHYEKPTDILQNEEVIKEMKERNIMEKIQKRKDMTTDEFEKYILPRLSCENSKNGLDMAVHIRNDCFDRKKIEHSPEPYRLSYESTKMHDIGKLIDETYCGNVPNYTQKVFGEYRQNCNPSEKESVPYINKYKNYRDDLDSKILDKMFADVKK